MYERDTTTLLSLRQSESAVDGARASLAQYQRQLAQDTHALTLVLGQGYLSTLDAQRSLYAAQQALVTIQQAELANRMTLYKSLGGGWEQHTASAQ
jgi:multidrug efflux system outer membrane protein